MEHIDELDRTLLRILQHEGDISNLELARRVSLSPPATSARVRRLREIGLISRFVALVDAERAGLDLLCFLQIGLQWPQCDHIDAFTAAVQGIPEVLECHHITGEYDCLLKVLVQSRRALEQLMMERLARLPGVSRLHTSVVLGTMKSTTALPIPN